MVILSTNYQQYIHISKYARWLPEFQRREIHWEETVKRYVDFMKWHCHENHNFFWSEDWTKKVFDHIHQLKSLPSMRCLMTAGEALQRDNAAGYNCSYLSIDTLESFSEVLYLLMCGCGVGFSVESKYTSQLPDVPNELNINGTYKIEDSKLGWCDAINHLMHSLFAGNIPNFDYSDIRPAGARLKTFGGRASGPEPLKDLFEFIIGTFKNARGRKLRPIECHDTVCKIASIVVMGGVRRSALISLSDLYDSEMASAKMGAFWENTSYRSFANNSAVFTSKPAIEAFTHEWLKLMESRCGERGIINRQAFNRQVKKNERRKLDYSFGCNPCAEIILRPLQFCNLTEVVIRQEDTEQTLLDKIEVATFLGTLQSTFTNFRFLRPQWQENCKEERLLGVSLTGIFDNKMMYQRTDKLKSLLENLKRKAIEVNKHYANIFSIPQSAAITTIKPSGTVSQLVDCSSGIHPRIYKYYWRTVRENKINPLSRMMKEQGVRYENCCMYPGSVDVFYFPVKSPDHALLARELGSIEHLEIWKFYQDHYCEHKPSCTIYVQDEDWLRVGDWVYRNFDDISGISFLPLDNHIYNQAPYIEISKEEYEKAAAQQPMLNWNKLSTYEKEDNTTVDNEFCCVGGSCEL